MCSRQENLHGVARLPEWHEVIHDMGFCALIKKGLLALMFLITLYIY